MSVTWLCIAQAGLRIILGMRLGMDKKRNLLPQRRLYADGLSVMCRIMLGRVCTVYHFGYGVCWHASMIL